ncbi:MAG: histidine kinase [Cyclobacteriaceae bacterium]|nr:histidine kinase [Cyclobacteriaceae bacterium]
MQHNTFFRLLWPLIHGVLIYILLLLINNDLSAFSSIFQGEEVYFLMFLSFLLFETCRLLIVTLDRYVPTQTSTSRRLFLQFTGNLLVSVFVVTSVLSAYFQLFLGFGVDTSQVIIFNVIFGLSTSLYHLFFLGQYFLHRENSARMAEEVSLRNSIKGQMARFKNEMNPGLLYESLETLIALMHKDVEESDEHIARLSAVYRYILSHRQSEFVELKEELAAIEDFRALVNYRYQGNVFFASYVPKEGAQSMLIPGALLKIFEYIVETTIISNTEPLEVELNMEGGYLVMQSRMNDRLKQKHTEIFDDIQAAYNIYTEKPVIKVKAWDINYIKVPILEERKEMVIL